MSKESLNRGTMPGADHSHDLRASGLTDNSVIDTAGKVNGTCSNKPRPSLQNNHSKGSQWWSRDVWHIAMTRSQTACNIDCTDWLQMGRMLPDADLCSRCRKAQL